MSSSREERGCVQRIVHVSIAVVAMQAALTAACV